MFWVFCMFYVGEFGWEFYILCDGVLQVYDVFWVVGEVYGIKDYGSFVMNVLCMEKGFKGVGELINEVILLEVDVMWFVKFDKDYFGVEVICVSVQ